MPWIRPTIHGTLIIQRGGDDATASTRLQRFQCLCRKRRATPFHDGIECDTTVTRIDEHEDVPRRKHRDLVQPEVKTYPGGRAIRLRSRVDGDKVTDFARFSIG